MTRRSVAFAAFLLTLACSLHAAAQGGNRIRGKVQTSDGKPLVQAIVILGTGTGTPVGQTVTNNEGDFYFDSLTDTSYIVSVNQPDYPPASEHVDFAYRSSI